MAPPWISFFRVCVVFGCVFITTSNLGCGWKVSPISVRYSDTLHLSQVFPAHGSALSFLRWNSQVPNFFPSVEFLTFSGCRISNAPCYLYNLKRSSLKFYMWHLCEPDVIWQNTFNMSF